MAFVRVVAGQEVEEAHINQFVDYFEGAGGVGGAIPFTNDSATDYTLTLKNLNASDRTFRVLDSDGSERLRINANGIYSPNNIYVGNDGISASPDVNHKMIIETDAGPGTQISDVFSVEVAANPGADHDIGSILAFCANESAGGNVTMRALAGQVVKFSITNPCDVQCIELGMHNAKSIVSNADDPVTHDAFMGACAITIYSHEEVQGEGPLVGVRNNTAILIRGGRGWKQGFLYYDTDDQTKLFEVNQNGRVQRRGADVYNQLLTPAAISSNQNNYAPTNINILGIVQISATAPFNITGISSTGFMSGQTLTLVNVGSQTITLTNADAASLAANRFALPGSANFSLTAGTAIRLYWDGSIFRAFA